MAGTKISNLTELASADDGDWLAIVDTTAGVTKKIDSANLVGASARGYTEVSGTGTINIDWSVSRSYKLTMGAGNVTLTFTDSEAGELLWLIVVQDSVGGRTITYPGSGMKHPGNVESVLSAGANEEDTLLFGFDGTSYYQMHFGPDQS